MYKCNQAIFGTVNIILMILGIASLGLGVAVLQFGDEYFAPADGSSTTLIDTQFVLAGIAVGGCFIFMASLGILGAFMDPPSGSSFVSLHRFILFFYGLFMIILILIEIIFGALGVLYVQDIESVKIDNNSTLNGGVETFNNFNSKFQQEVDAFLDAQYGKCCTAPITATTTMCTVVRDSLGLNAGGFTVSGGYNACGVDAQGFRTKFVEWIGANINRIAIGMIVMAVVEIFMVISSCALMCHKPPMAAATKPVNKNVEDVAV